MDQNENSQARFGGFPSAIGASFSNQPSSLDATGPGTTVNPASIGASFSNQPSSLNATGSWTYPSYPSAGEDPDSLLASDPETSTRLEFHNNRLYRNCQESVAAIEQSQPTFFLDRVDDSPWNPERASAEERMLFEGHPLFAETPSFWSLNEILAWSLDEVSSASAEAKRKRFANFELRVRARMEQYQNENVQAVFHPTSGHSSNQRRRFACPFHKYDQMMHRAYTSRPVACWERGFTEISRLKEHLDRDHARLLRCMRCLLKMKTSEDMSDHERKGCKESCWRPDDWIEVGQMDEIKTPRKTWNEIFKILFGDVSMPSPYYDVDVTISGMTYVPNLRRQVDSENYNWMVSYAVFVESLERAYCISMEDRDAMIMRNWDKIAQRFPSIIAQDPLPGNSEETRQTPLPTNETPSSSHWPLDHTEVSQSANETEDNCACSNLGSNPPDSGSNCENCEGLNHWDPAHDFEH